MHSILHTILEKKKIDLLEQKDKLSIDSLRKLTLSIPYRSNLKTKLLSENGLVLIGEIKLASPTINFIGSPNKVIEKAKEYEKVGANAISYITEKHFFKGRKQHIQQIKKETILPILQKDFVIDEYQIYHAKYIGSDAILLIAKILTMGKLALFVEIAQEIGIEPVVEVNDLLDLEKALNTHTKIIAVNARNLDTFEVSVDFACELIKKIPRTYLRLGFSGITSVIEAKKYKNAGVKGVLIGTSLMLSNNISSFISEIKSV